MFQLKCILVLLCASFVLSQTYEATLCASFKMKDDSNSFRRNSTCCTAYSEDSTEFQCSGNATSLSVSVSDTDACDMFWFATNHHHHHHGSNRTGNSTNSTGFNSKWIQFHPTSSLSTFQRVVNWFSRLIPAPLKGYFGRNNSTNSTSPSHHNYTLYHNYTRQNSTNSSGFRRMVGACVDWRNNTFGTSYSVVMESTNSSHTYVGIYSMNITLNSSNDPSIIQKAEKDSFETLQKPQFY